MTTSDKRWLYAQFERAAARFPERVALEWEVAGSGVHGLTYAELVARSRDVADLVRDTAGGPSRVAVLAHPGPQTLVGYLGALAAGATVVPLDPGWPMSRTARVVELAGLHIAVSAGSPEQLPAAWEVLAEAHGVHVLSLGPRQPDVGASDTEYVLFTSGTTGDPKGVPIGAAQVAAFVPRATSRYGIDHRSRTSQSFALTFDLSVFDLFCTWSVGGCLCLPMFREASLLARYVNRARLTHWFGVPSALTVASQLGMLNPGSMPGLEVGMVCGEAFRVPQAESLLAAAPRAQVFNLYGPTELTIACADYLLDREDTRWRSTENQTVPIGTVFDSHDYLLAGADGSPAPNRGELCVRGPQRFGGYLIRSEDAGRFWPPGAADAATLDNYYRTGDVVAIVDGVLVHLGRGDRQIQVGGFRVEMGDVESALRSCTGVLEAVVYSSETDGVVSLGAVCVADATSPDHVLRELRNLVPGYMVPRQVLLTSDTPTSAHGKLDRAALLRCAQSSQP